MKLRELGIRLLVRFYPAAWRREFGEEFVDLLLRSPLSVPVLANVLVGAFGERVMNLFRRIVGGDEMADRTFNARYDRMAKIGTGIAVAVLVAVPLMAMRAGTVAAFVALVSAAVIGLGFAYSPRGYEISGGALRVKRLVGDVVFPLNTLRFVRDANAADFWGCVRLWGSGGLFGYYGLFWSKALGRSRWYVTDRSKAMILADGDRVILVSPDDREAFVAAIPHRDSAMTATASGSASGVAGSLVVGLAIGGVTLGLVASAMLYSPGRPPVDLTRDSLVIHSRFYGMTVLASSVDVSGVRVVDLQTDPDWKPVLRTGGFGNPFYRAGNFRTASGRAVKLFTTGTQRLLLLPPSREDGTPVLLDAADPDQLAARVRAEWSGR
ncbi:MAG: PH domain-containing protein [Acidobacteriota bacterium]